MQLFLERGVRRDHHGRQHFERAEHQVRQVVVLNQFMNVLRQFLNAHVFVEFRIFTIQRRQHVFHPQVQVERAFEIGQRTQQAQRFGFVDTDTVQEQQVVRTGFFDHDTVLVEILRHDARRNTELIHGAVFLHPRSQQRDFNRVEIHMLVIDVFETVPCAVGAQRPAFRTIDMFRLPDIEEPAVGLAFQTFNLFTELD